MINVAMIGFGGIAQAVHFPAYAKLEKMGKAKLVAICDIDDGRFNQKMKINIAANNASISEEINKYTDWRQMLDNEEIDMVDICIPTYMHAPITIEVLKLGYDVLCEKPMSLNYDLCQEMIKAAEESGKKLMIGQCLRFDNYYNYIKKVVDEKTYGKVKTGIFRRLSTPPVWGWENWFMDYSKSGGCITDLHIHDIDYIRYIFGEPEKVSCHTQDVYSQKDIAHTVVEYPEHTVLVIGDWSQEGVPFVADCRIAFENATVDYSNNKITVYPRGGESFEADVIKNDMYFSEIEYFIDKICSGEENTKNPPESAAASIKLIETLIESSNQNGETLTFRP